MPTTTTPQADPSRPDRPGRPGRGPRRSGAGGGGPVAGGRLPAARAAGRNELDPPGRRELLLELLRASAQPRAILGLADELGVHANTVRFHLEALQHAGQVEQVLAGTAGPGRPPILFRATHRMNPDGPTNYRLLATMLTEHLATRSPDPAAAATELGRAWGSHLLSPATTGHARSQRVKRGAALTQLTRVLNDLGFAPEPPAGARDTTIRLRHCPFLSLVTGADTRPRTDTDTRVEGEPASPYGGVICSLHLGLMQGALASLNGPVTADRLEPFLEPDLCVAHLAPAATGRGHGHGHGIAKKITAEIGLASTGRVDE